MTLFIALLAVFGCFFVAVIVVQKINGGNMDEAITTVCDWLKANFSSQSNNGQLILVNVPYFREEMKKIVDKYSNLDYEVTDGGSGIGTNSSGYWIEFVGAEEKLAIFKMSFEKIVENTLKMANIGNFRIIMSVEIIGENHYKIFVRYATNKTGISELNERYQCENNLKKESAKNGLGAPVDADLERELNNEC